MKRAALFALLCTAALHADFSPGWNKPIAPFKITANIYYVGTNYLASYLIATPQGAILINPDYEESVPLIKDSVEKLGFRFTDVKIILISHAHDDHAAGAALAKKLSGAKLMVMDADVPVMEQGGAGDFQYSTRWAPAKVDRTLHDLDQVTLGGFTLTAHLTPGHTKGCTTWTTDTPEGHVVIVGSAGVNDGYKLAHNDKYPAIADDYRKTFAVLRALPCDIFLGAHGSYFDMNEKLARLKAGSANPFIDPNGYRAFVGESEADFKKKVLASENLPVKWEELTAEDFQSAIKQSSGTCLLPFGIVEKHGPQLPLGTDLINVRYVSEHAAATEYAVVFPPYFYGQIFEARHQPGTLAYSAKLQLELLQETTDEMARNGCKKILIVNGHGGNNNLLPFFAQSQLAAPHDYVVYVYLRSAYPPGRPALKTNVDSHAGESETAHTLIARPDLVHQDRSGKESGADLNRLDLPAGVYTGIWWYAKFPNHYAGDGAAATTELGTFDMNAWTDALANAIRAVKSDQRSLSLQREFFEETSHPADTKQ